jgi:glucose/arabinose dehydrogenase
MEFSPDGRLFVAQQAGALRVIKDPHTSPNLLPTPFVTLSNVDPNGERGLLGIAFDPNFATNNFIYLYYTTTEGGVHNRIIRLTANGDVAVPGSQVTITDLDGLSGATNHNGGAIHFGTDGKLYIAVGDNANSANAQSVSNRHGKILRINPDGGIPPDNPASFVTSNGTLTPTGNNRAIWAMGFRNPFTFDVNPVSGKVYVNDVGNFGGSRREEVNDVQAGRNYGWPVCEGPCGDSRFTNPVYNYPDGCAITGGTFYNPATNQFPSEYVSDYFLADFCGGWIRRLDNANPSTAVSFASSIDDPVDLKDGPDGSLYYLARNDGVSNGGYIRRIFYDNSPPPPAVYKWCEAESSSLVAPMQTAADAAASGGNYIFSTATDVTSTPPTTTGSGTLNFTIPSGEAGNYTLWTRLNYPNGEGNSYWAQFDNDTSKQFLVGNENDFGNWHWVNWQNGDTNNKISVNLAAGNHTLKLIGREGAAKIDKILLTTSTVFVPSGNGDSVENCTNVSNQAPTASITSPSSGTQYSHGDVINFSGTGTDPEDGTLPASAFVWDILFFHDDGLPHTHPHLTIPNGTAPASKSGSFTTNFSEASPNVHYIVRLTVTDSGGKTHMVERNVTPRKSNITLATNPSGLLVNVDGTVQNNNAPHTFQSVVNYPRTIRTFTPQSQGGTTYAFSSWSDGGSVTHTINTPTANMTYTATFTPTAGRPGDTDSDGDVDIFDLSSLIGLWGTSDSRADFDGNGTINIFDLSILLTNWGS